MKRVNVSRELKRLREANIIEQHLNKGVRPQTLSIVKNYEKWSVESCAVLPLSNLITVINSDNPTVINSDNHTYKENTKDNTKERVERKAPLPCHIGDNKRAFVNDDNYMQLVSEYGAEVIDKYIKRADKWAFKKGKDLGECSDTLRRWLEQDGVEKIDPEIEQYKKFINQFQPL